MARKKLHRIRELECLPNVFDGRGRLRPNWLDGFFKNHNPVVLELGCGRGEVTVELARMFPRRNFLGVDKNGARIWKGATRSHQSGLDNSVFLHSDVEELDRHLGPARIEEIWIPFPDPLCKRRQAPRRLVAPGLLKLYRRLLKEGGSIHLKTDHEGLFSYVLQILERVGGRIHERLDDLHASLPPLDLRRLTTTYEKRHLAAGKRIKYLHFSLPRPIGPAPPRSFSRRAFAPANLRGRFQGASGPAA